MADPTRNIRDNMSYLKQYVIIEKEQRFARTASGKSWKTKPESETFQKIPADWYHNVFDAIPFMKGLGGTERTEYSYTYAGYLPTQLTSTSPDRETKVIRRYYIVPDMEHVPHAIREKLEQEGA